MTDASEREWDPVVVAEMNRRYPPGDPRCYDGDHPSDIATLVAKLREVADLPSGDYFGGDEMQVVERAADLLESLSATVASLPHHGFCSALYNEKWVCTCWKSGVTQ